MEEFYLAVWDSTTLNLMVKLSGPRVPKSGEELTVDFDDPNTEVTGGMWMNSLRLRGSQIYPITPTVLSAKKIEGLPVVECQLTYQH